MQDVFISYSSIDQVAADAVCHHLEENGIRCWIAHRDIKPGQEWTVAIMNAIRNTRVFVLIYSHNSNASKQVLNEVSNAFSSGSVIIPFRLDMSDMSDGLAYYLHSVHWLDATSQSMQKSIASLHRTVRAVLDAAEEPPAFPKQPRKKPEQKKKKRVWHWILMGVVVQLLVVSLMISGAVHLIKGNSPDAYFFCVSHIGRQSYPGLSADMLSANLEQIVLWDYETEQLKSVNIADPDFTHWALEDPSYELANGPIIYSEDNACVYFLDQIANEISVYDRERDSWSAKDVKLPEMSDTEYLQLSFYHKLNMLTDQEQRETIVLLYADGDFTDGKTPHFTKFITVKPDGSYLVADCSQLNLTNYICCFEDLENPEAILMMDAQQHLLVVNSQNGQVITRDLATIYAEYMPKSTALGNQASPNGRFVACYDVTAKGNQKTTVWDLERGDSPFSKESPIATNVYFMDDNSIIYWDHSTNGLYTQDLDAGAHPKEVLSGAYFSDKAFADTLWHFYYSSEYDLCFFVSQGTDFRDEEPYYLLTVTDRAGEIVAKSDKFYLDHANVTTGVTIADSSVFLYFVSNTDACIQHTEYVAIYRALYTVDAEGNLQFKDSYQ